MMSLQTRQSTKPNTGPRPSPTVLVLDDEPAIRKSLGGFLEASGYAVVEAENVDGALDVLRQASIDAVILDVRMPDARGLQARSGLEVLAFLRLHDELAELPVLILTGYVMNAEEEELIRRHGAYMFFKPEGYGTLVRYLDRFTGRAQGRSH